MKRLRITDFAALPESCHFACVEIPHEARPPLHTHDFSELFWVESGRGLHHINGACRPLRPGMLVFVRAADCHGFSAESPGERFTICNLAFATRTVTAILARHKLRWFETREAAAREHLVSKQTFAFLRHAGDEWLGSSRSLLHLERFFLNLAAALESDAPVVRSGAPPWLQEALIKLEQNRLFREGPPALTRLAGRSQEHVVRETRRWFQKTPSALINEMRMRYAARCLSSSTREIIDICFDCGLENLGHFYALFRQTYGLTPRQYRLRGKAVVRTE